jgi:hypothetical protein
MTTFGIFLDLLWENLYGRKHGKVGWGYLAPRLLPRRTPFPIGKTWTSFRTMCSLLGPAILGQRSPNQGAY